GYINVRAGIVYLFSLPLLFLLPSETGRPKSNRRFSPRAAPLHLVTAVARRAAFSERPVQATVSCCPHSGPPVRLHLHCPFSQRRPAPRLRRPSPPPTPHLCAGISPDHRAATPVGREHEGPLKPVADLPSSCSPASHHPLQFITDVGLAASHAESKVSPCRQADGSPSAEVMGPEVSLPEDIIWKIHALMAIQDAARAACLSHDFLHSWRCYPKLIFDMRALGKQTRDFTK
uniref:Uncharacterized protein n=2 Tax=Aegilops tauschii subsp. strangulata TaxID=200361 RepID=A0A453AUD3_AEGTS